jgi:hypothetical protein
MNKKNTATIKTENTRQIKANTVEDAEFNLGSLVAASRVASHVISTVKVLTQMSCNMTERISNSHKFLEQRALNSNKVTATGFKREGHSEMRHFKSSGKLNVMA